MIVAILKENDIFEVLCADSIFIATFYESSRSQRFPWKKSALPASIMKKKLLVTFIFAALIAPSSFKRTVENWASSNTWNFQLRILSTVKYTILKIRCHENRFLCQTELSER